MIELAALCAAWAATIAFGAWLVIRDEPTDPPQNSASSRPPFGSADGARADHLPPAGAGPTSTLPAPVALPGRSARSASGDPT